MDVMDGAMFVFLARRRQSAKVLLWDGTGLVVIHKRLERGRFANIFSENNSVVTLTTSELSLLLEGTKFSPGTDTHRLADPKHPMGQRLTATAKGLLYPQWITALGTQRNTLRFRMHQNPMSGGHLHLGLLCDCGKLVSQLG